MTDGLNSRLKANWKSSLFHKMNYENENVEKEINLKQIFLMFEHKSLVLTLFLLENFFFFRIRETVTHRNWYQQLLLGLCLKLAFMIMWTISMFSVVDVTRVNINTVKILCHSHIMLT